MTFLPQDSFQKGPHFKGWKDLVASEQFFAGVSAALNQLSAEASPAKDAFEAAANYHRMDGARRFLHILLNLAETEPETGKPAKAANLQHRV